MTIQLKDLEELRNKIAEERKKLEEQERALLILEQKLVNEAPTRIKPTEQSETFNLGELNVPTSNMSTLTDSVRALLKRIGCQEFTVADIEALLKQKGVELGGKAPRVRIEMALSDLVKEGEAIRTFRRVGSRPHRFKARAPTKIEKAIKGENPNALIRTFTSS